MAGCLVFYLSDSALSAVWDVDVVSESEIEKESSKDSSERVMEIEWSAAVWSWSPGDSPAVWLSPVGSLQLEQSLFSDHGERGPPSPQV